MSQNTALLVLPVSESGAFNLVDLDGQQHICTNFSNNPSVGTFEGVGEATDPEECQATEEFKVVVNQADAITDSNGNEYWPWVSSEFTGRPPRTNRPNA